MGACEEFASSGWAAPEHSRMGGDLISVENEKALSLAAVEHYQGYSVIK